MSITEAERFADRVETDDAFVATLAAATDPAAVYQVVLDNGYDVQPEEIRAVFLERHGDELTPEQLDAINGGGFGFATDRDQILAEVYFGTTAALSVMAVAVF